MPANDGKVGEIILGEVGRLEPRCEGYADVLTEAIVDILNAERLHRIKGTNIQQQVTDKCNAVGEFLASTRTKSRELKEE